MALILNIETSTEICSVALGQNGVLLSEKTDAGGQNHARLLTVLINQLLIDANCSMAQLDAVAISQGPGSYTGLRIGTSVAKGIAYALGIPLIAVNTLQAMASAGSQVEGLVCPMIDARRMEVYCQMFDKRFCSISEVEAKILDENSFANVLDDNPITFLGNGAPKFQEICQHPNARFLSENILTPVASQMLLFSEEKFQKANIEDVAYFTPFYLKQFQVTRSKKKIF